MLLGRHGDAGDVDASDQIAMVGEDNCVVMGGHLAGPIAVDVHDADQIDVPQLRIHARVVLAHVADADHARAQATLARRHHTTSRSRPSALSAAEPRQPPGGGTRPRREGAATNSMRRVIAGSAGNSLRIRSRARPGARPLR